MTDPIGTVDLDDSIFTLGTELSGFAELVEQGWGTLTTATRKVTDGFVRVAAGLLGTEWTGATRDSFAEHRSALTRALDAIENEMATRRDAARELLALAESAESRLQDALGRLAPLGPVREGGAYRITVHSEADLEAVRATAAEAEAIKHDFHVQVERLNAVFKTSVFTEASLRWVKFADGRYNEDGNWPAGPAGGVAVAAISTPVETFQVPERGRTMVTRGWEGTHLYGTNTRIDSVEVIRKDTGWYVVKFDDTYHLLEPGGTDHIYIRSQGETFVMDLRTGAYAAAEGT